MEPLNILCFLATVAKKHIYPNNQLCGLFILVEKVDLCALEHQSYVFRISHINRKTKYCVLLLGNSLNYSVYQKVGTGEKFDQA